MISGTTQWIDGVQLVNGMAVRGESAIQEAKPYVVGADGTKEVIMGVYIDGQPVLYRSETAGVSAVTACHLYGKAYPVGTPVYLSKVSDGTPTLDELRAGKYAEITPDETGAWQTDAPDAYNGTIAAWIRVPILSYADSSDAGISITADQEEPETPQGKVLEVRKQVDVTSGSGGCSLTYHYTCPDDVTSIELYEVKETISMETCPICNGAGTIDSTVFELCFGCNGSGAIETPSSEPCQSCGGSGLVDDEMCPECGGRGSIESFVMETCPSCGGSGSIENPTVETCPECYGAGSMEVVSEDQTLLERSIVAGGSGSVSVSFYPETGTVTLLWKCTTGDVNGTLSITVTESNPLCLSGDTLITMADGCQKRLDALTADDTVLGGDGSPARIIRLGRGIWSERHVLYHFDDGTVIDAVHDHRFYNAEQGFWQLLSRWEAGEHARCSDGTETALAAVEPVEERAERYNLWVERGSYWANGLLSGDASANRPLLADATAEQAADMAASLDEQAVLRIFGMEGIMP